MMIKVESIPTMKPAAVSLGNFDIHEDENILVNRLYYAVPRFENGRFHCSFFYEENTFRKEPNGDLMLVCSGYGTENPQQSELPASE